MAIVRGRELRYEAVNRAYRQYMGERDFIGRAAVDVVDELVAQGLIDVCDEVLRTGQPYIARDMRVQVRRFKGKAPVDTRVDFILQPLHDHAGVVDGIFLQGQDITSLRLAEDELRASREELAAALSALQAILDHSHDVICTTDSHGVYTRVSRRAELLWGYRPEEMVGRHFRDFIHPQDLESSSTHATALRDGEATTTFVNRIVHRDGSLVPVMWSSVWSEAHQTTFAIARDMREHQLAEEKLRQAQKMEAVGRLTGGVAHDFNNLLTAIIASAETLNEALQHTPELADMAQTVLDAADKGAELVRRLLTFSRQQPLAARPIDCDEFLGSMRAMLTRTLGEDVELVLDSADPGLRCAADPVELSSAILNLCFNARDAMPDGGRIVMKVSRVPRAEGHGPGLVSISVTDTGHGMSPDVLERATEPFFTTKAAGTGTGLGLSSVFGFVTQSGGRMDIHSAVGMGATVHLLLPETTQDANPEPLVRPSSRETLWVLIVEDDDLVREQVVRQLVALGHVATACRNPAEALERLAGGEAVDILMTDVVMPGRMNGRQLADHARLMNPGLRVLFISGYNQDTVLRKARRLPRTDFLPKPFRRSELGRRLSNLMLDD